MDEKETERLSRAERKDAGEFGVRVAAGAARGVGGGVGSCTRAATLHTSTSWSILGWLPGNRRSTGPNRR